jgi:hypothetical protein
MNPRSYALLLIAGLAVAAGTASAKTPTAEAVVQKAVATADSGSALADQDMIRMSIRQEETTSDGSTESSQLTALIHGGALENTRVELSQGVSLVLNNKTGWALIRGQLDARPQTPRMAAGTVRQTLFPLLLPFSLQMQGVNLGVVTEGNFDSTPVWVVEATFELEFFAAPSMVTTWFVFIDRETNLVVGAEYLPTDEFRAIRAEGIRYRYLKRQTVGGINFAAQVLLDGIDFNGAENGHVRVTKVSSTTSGPLDLSLFINPEERDRMDAGEVF